MADIEHKTLGYAEQHVVHFKEYANADARTGAVGLTEDDDYKVALQTNDHSLWILTDYSGPTWVALALVADDTVTTAKIKDANVTSAKFAKGAVGPWVTGFNARSRFKYKDADEIYLYPGCYHHHGTTEQLVYWDTLLTFTFANLAASDWSYLYLDDSAIVTAATNLISVSELIDSTTEPAWSNAKHGWYNGEDKCIFAVRTNGDSEILEFFHDGDLVVFADQIVNLNGSTDCDSWTDATLTIPKFTQKAEVLIRALYSDTETWVYWRTNGQTGATGHIVGFVGTICSVCRSVATVPVITDATQKIEVQFGAETANVMDVYTYGWYFPIGL